MFKYAAIAQESDISEKQTFADEQILKAQTFAHLTRADDIIRQARQQSDQILAEAKEVYRQQHQLGYRQGLAEGKKELAALHLDATVKVQDFLHKVNDELVALVMVALRRIIDDLAPQEVTAQVIKQTLKTITDEKSITLRVAPESAQQMEAQLAEIVADYPGLGYLHIEADHALSEQQGCILETETGVVDALVDTQLEVISKTLASHYRT
ncbi:HrpE/YscL family type III secretion apparatus protein [Thalassomonas actiniarum]|uniref:Type 3 secretion system stator protein n=1 Tax=Thalassomonas actiniarum TaxID=485447 RepID=A0AAE9YIK9_9GAMM|nr:HrpE/YscL family type III secretion apparatus protein [Thalassomonas actiniarum]WDD96612.1 HrpE/YscL family type III secretion apparatus protein [Thalassomonas actiniarum]